MKIIGFAGPSIGNSKNERSNKAIQWFPPASLGDFLSAIHRYLPDVVVLVDILPWPSLSVWHKEILWALSHGIRVVGTGAGGAIRAAELSFSGMRGYGRVYEMYSGERFEDDSAVLCRFEHTDNCYRRVTEPLVNIIATLSQGQAEDMLTGEERSLILEVAQKIFFEERTREHLLERVQMAGAGAESCQSLNSLLENAYVDQQAIDVEQTLLRLEDPGFLGAPPSPETIPISVKESTTLFRNLYDRDRTVSRGDVKMRLYEVGDYFTTHSDTIEPDSKNALNRELALILVEKLGLDVSQAEIKDSAEEFRYANGLQKDQDWSDWLYSNDMNELDARRIMEEEALLKKLRTAFLAGHMYQRNTRPLLDYMRLQNRYVQWRDRAFDREEKIKSRAETVHDTYMRVDFEQLLQHKQATSPLPWSLPVQTAADALGISAKSFIIELIKDKLSGADLDQEFIDKLASALE
jgi:hypothetical protein